jgi:hypothetical protein
MNATSNRIPYHALSIAAAAAAKTCDPRSAVYLLRKVEEADRRVMGPIYRRQAMGREGRLDANKMGKLGKVES